MNNGERIDASIDNVSEGIAPLIDNGGRVANVPQVYEKLYEDSLLTRRRHIHMCRMTLGTTNCIINVSLHGEDRIGK